MTKKKNATMGGMKATCDVIDVPSVITRNNRARIIRKRRSWYLQIVRAADIIEDYIEGYMWEELGWRQCSLEAVESGALHHLIASTTSIRDRIAILSILTTGTLVNQCTSASFMMPSYKTCAKNIPYVKKCIRSHRRIDIRVDDQVDTGEDIYVRKFVRVW